MADIRDITVHLTAAFVARTNAPPQTPDLMAKLYFDMLDAVEAEMTIRRPATVGADYRAGAASSGPGQRNKAPDQRR
jgi:hypothetical protein